MERSRQNITRLRLVEERTGEDRSEVEDRQTGRTQKK
jgi:hypothetical protein